MSILKRILDALAEIASALFFITIDLPPNEDVEISADWLIRVY